MSAEVLEQQFTAAVGLEHFLNGLVKGKMDEFYQSALLEYQKEVRHERARLMRQKNVDYMAVRGLDRTLNEVTQTLHKMALEKTLRGE